MSDRLHLIHSAISDCQTWLGEVSVADMEKLIARDLGKSGHWIPFSPLLHIVSGNTPHAAFQSVFRGLLAGAHNRVKLPSDGLPEFENWHSALPSELKSQVEVRHDLPREWRESAEAVVAYGSDSTLTRIYHSLHPHQRFIAHGHKVSIGIIAEPSAEAATLAARDVCLFDQLGCLSLINLYCPADSIESFGELLAKAMKMFSEEHPRSPVSPSISGAITNLRQLTHFRAANEKGIHIWHSTGNTDWTVIANADPAIEPTPLYRTVILKPIPEDLSQLGEHSRHLSTVSLYPHSKERARDFRSLPASRICPLGMTQQPSIFWNADGYSPLAPLVRWQDVK